MIPAGADVRRLEEHHRSEPFDHAGIRQDANLAFPLDRLRELARLGEIGEVAPRHLSFMGSITAPGRLTSRTAPEAAQLLVDDRVDVALLSSAAFMDCWGAPSLRRRQRGAAP